MPKIDGLLETVLYVADLDRAAAFYREVLGLSAMLSTPRLAAFDAGRSGSLLLFRKGLTERDEPTSGGTIPGHYGEGKLHLAFAIATAELDAWRHRLERRGVPIRSEVAWPRGGRSLYFDDPDGHVVELATPGLWPNY